MGLLFSYQVIIGRRLAQGLTVLRSTKPNGKAATPLVTFAEDHAAPSVGLIYLSHVVADPAIVQRTECKKVVASNSGPNFSAVGLPCWRSAGPPNVNVVDRAAPKPALILIDIPARPPLATLALAHDPDFGKSRRGKRHEHCNDISETHGEFLDTFPKLRMP
jgi:hypothetical protein